jgi:ABC-type phosphate/phosphonate transport system ATPase subunit
MSWVQKALKIEQKIGNLHGEATTTYLLATIHHQLGNLDLAHEYCDRALSIATELGIPLAKECQELKEKLLNDIPQNN